LEYVKFTIFMTQNLLYLQRLNQYVVGIDTSLDELVRGEAVKKSEIIES